MGEFPMRFDVEELPILLEQQIAVGERLRATLLAQREALMTWDMNALIASVESRFGLIKSLQALETRRCYILESMSVVGSAPNLKELANCCKDREVLAQRLLSLRAQAYDTFCRLQADERDFVRLMSSLVLMLRAALESQSRYASIYSKAGVAIGPAITTLLSSKV
jgi:hypothetical protein